MFRDDKSHGEAKSVDKSDMKAVDAVKEYLFKVYGEDNESINNTVFWHDLSHVIAAGLTHPEHMMDFEYSNKHLPKDRMAGFESEPIAIVYEYFLRDYPNNNKHYANISFRNPEDSIERVLDYCKYKQGNVAVEDKGKIENGEDLAPNRTNKHNQERKDIAEGKKEIIYPSHDEIMHHWNKAVELVQIIKNREGKYPSKMSSLFGSIKNKPLSMFAIDNFYQPEKELAVGSSMSSETECDNYPKAIISDIEHSEKTKNSKQIR